MVEQDGDRLGTILMRKFAVRYLSGVVGSRAFRDRITRAENAAEFRAIVEESFPEDRIGGHDDAVAPQPHV
jgi:tRNA-dihydrouridine synthase